MVIELHMHLTTQAVLARGLVEDIGLVLEEASGEAEADLFIDLRSDTD